MKLDNSYQSIITIVFIFFYSNINISTEVSFGLFQVFLVELGSQYRTSNRAVYLINGVECSNSVGYKLLPLPEVRIEPAKDF